MKPITHMLCSLPLFLSLGACGEDLIVDTSETGQETEPDTVDTDDTDPVPVWTDERAETSDTFNGVYASGRGVYTVANDGKLWTYASSTGWTDQELEVDEEEINGIWGQGNQDALVWVAVGNAGKVAHYAGGDVTVNDLGTASSEAVDGTSADGLIAVGWGAAYSWDGASWTYEPLPNHESLWDVWVSGSSAIGVGEDGAIVRREGGSWVAMESPTGEALYGVDGAADNDLWAVGQDGVLLHFNGTMWEQRESFTEQTLWAVYAPSSAHVYAVGNNGTAYHYDGSSWSELYTGVDSNLYDVHGTSETDCWAVGNRGTALHYTGA